jgi:hypothetical protein
LTRSHLVEGLLEVSQLEDVGNHALRLDLTAVEVLNGTREAVGLREGANNLENMF